MLALSLSINKAKINFSPVPILEQSTDTAPYGCSSGGSCQESSVSIGG
ncbi:MAG: hypothetical protein F6K36_28040 [Symploca sp. SIO3C6]|nr:hypothetical protein [Symploca sp. SIO3C6]